MITKQRRDYRGLARRAIAVCPELDRPAPDCHENIRPDSGRGGFYLHQEGGVQFAAYDDVLSAVTEAEQAGRKCVLTIMAGLRVEA